MDTKRAMYNVISIEGRFVASPPSTEDVSRIVDTSQVNSDAVVSSPLTPKRILRGSSVAFPFDVDPGCCISVDVFDTLLHRKPISERRRFFLAAAAFVRMCPHNPKPLVQTVYAARVEANRWAYHSIDTLKQDAEIRLADIFRHQLLILGLSPELVPFLIAAEVEVEKRVLLPNTALIRWLREQRSRRVPVIAISDTAMSRETLQDIIDEIVGPSTIDRLYTSADLGLSKRNGGIFAAVAALENISTADQFHFGDSRHADFVRANAAGINATHLPLSRAFIAKRKLDGVRFEFGQFTKRLAARLRRTQSADRSREDSRAFGRNVLGPIFARYCLRMWLYLSYASLPGDDAVALFCARGGLHLRSIFEAFIDRLGLPLTTPRSDLMISRLVAVRAAILQESPSAFEEIQREFHDASMAKIAQAIAQLDCGFGKEWDHPFEAQLFLHLMRSTEAGERFRQRLVEQNELFKAHLESLTSEKTRLILCDTGLYGSTLRMLQGGLPDRQWECLLFARCNYKGFDAEHFKQTRGVVSNYNMYDPAQPSSTVLRYWQLFEHIFEPALESVKTFSETADGTVRSNLESDGWQQRMESHRSPLLEGIFDYFSELPREGWFEKVCREEPASWRRLKSSVLFPDPAVVRVLDTGERSHDFGREEKYQTLHHDKKSSLRHKFKSLQGARWKEGYITQEFPALRLFMQGTLESFYVLRWMRSRMSSLVSKA